MVAVSIGPVVGDRPTGERRRRREEEVTLTMGSWRSDDVVQMETLLAALHEAHPEHHGELRTDPQHRVQRRAAHARWRPATPPTCSTCVRTPTVAALFDEGFVAPLTDVGLDESFSEASLDPWSADGVTYGLPFIAVSHGIYYNADLFAEHGIEVPETWADLLAAAETLDAAGITPFANATGDEWTMAEMLWMNLAPSFIGGREGRLAYESGRAVPQRRGHRQRVPGDGRPGAVPARGQEALTYTDSQQLWLLEEAAMWIGGSWDIPYFEGQEPDFEWSEFQIPTPEGGTKAVTFHLDAGIGINADTEHMDAAADRHRVARLARGGDDHGRRAARLLPGPGRAAGHRQPSRRQLHLVERRQRPRRALHVAGAQRRHA